MVNDKELGRRGNVRHRVASGRNVKVTIESRCDESPSAIEAELIDVSRSGIRLVAPASPAIHATVTLRFQIPGDTTNLVVDATVCWTRPVGKNSWSLGCTISSPLPSDMLSLLAVNGYVQRRSCPRQRVDCHAAVRWETTTTEQPVRVVNLSAGGFCLACSQPARVDERFRLELQGENDTKISILARARWQTEVAEGYHIGCTFVHRDGLRHFREALRHSEKPEATRVVPRRKSNGTLLALLVILLTTLLTFIG
ncbi:MAG: PilZ domain-containing protein, partial [Planctomycetes bacterium]|nr:PilZ domain-containing protein [Planctomycetota bacterium]